MGSIRLNGSVITSLHNRDIDPPEEYNPSSYQPTLKDRRKWQSRKIEKRRRYWFPSDSLPTYASSLFSPASFHLFTSCYVLYIFTLRCSVSSSPPCSCYTLLRFIFVLPVRLTPTSYSMACHYKSIWFRLLPHVDWIMPTLVISFLCHSVASTSETLSLNCFPIILSRYTAPS